MFQLQVMSTEPKYLGLEQHFALYLHQNEKNSLSPSH